MLATFFHTFILVFVAEMGDKTQLLVLSFTGRFRTRDIVIGAFSATVAAHALAVTLGGLVGAYLEGPWLSRAVGLLFIGFGIWALRPEEEEEEGAKRGGRLPAVAVAIAFFLAELGDKTQLAAAGLAAAEPHPWAVLAGAVIGMWATILIAVLFGEALSRRIPEKAMRVGAAVLFIATGVWFILG